MRAASAVQRFARQLERHAHAHHLVGRHGARAQAPLLAAAELQRALQLHAAAAGACAALRHHQGADSLWAVHLVRRQRHQIQPRDSQNRRGHLPTLCAASTCSRAPPCRAQIAAMRGDVLDHADLIVDVHDGHQHGVRPQRRGNLRGLEQAVADRAPGR